MANYPKLSDSPWHQLASSLPAILLRLKENQTQQSNKEREFQMQQQQMAKDELWKQKLFDEQNRDQDTDRKYQSDRDFMKDYFTAKDDPYLQETMLLGLGDRQIQGFNKTNEQQRLVRAKTEYDNKLEMERRKDQAYINANNALATIRTERDNLNPRQKWELDRIDNDITAIDAQIKMYELDPKKAPLVQQLQQQRQALLNKADNVFGISSADAPNLPQGQALIENPKTALKIGTIMESAGISQSEYADMVAENLDLYDITNENELMSRISDLIKQKATPQRYTKKQPWLKRAGMELNQMFTGKRAPFIRDEQDPNNLFKK